ncbi:MAG: YeeE/YedE family protein [Pseudomonadota bacterium]
MPDLLTSLLDGLAAPYWPPVLAGLLIGLLAFGQRWATDEPLACSTGFARLAQWHDRPREDDWRLVFLLGIVLGGAIAGLTDGMPAWEGTAEEFGAFYAALVPDTAIGSAAWWLAGGVLIGLGARLAGGCTSGHTIAGVAMGAPASLTASAVFFGIAVGTAQLAAWILGV